MQNPVPATGRGARTDRAVRALRCAAWRRNAARRQACAPATLLRTRQRVPTRHVVRRSGIEILCHALDLDANPATLLGEVRKLAGHIAESKFRHEHVIAPEIR